MFSMISFILVVIGSFNWLLVGILQFNLVAWLFGSNASIVSRIVYVLVGISAIWLVVQAILTKGKINIARDAVEFRAIKTTQNKD